MRELLRPGNACELEGSLEYVLVCEDFWTGDWCVEMIWCNWDQALIY